MDISGVAADEIEQMFFCVWSCDWIPVFANGERILALAGVSNERWPRIPIVQFFHKFRQMWLYLPKPPKLSNLRHYCLALGSLSVSLVFCCASSLSSPCLLNLYPKKCNERISVWRYLIYCYSPSRMKRIQKANLPRKICIVCERPFSWRKKWKNCWEEVLYCSNGCRKRKSSAVKNKP